MHNKLQTKQSYLCMYIHTYIKYGKFLNTQTRTFFTAYVSKNNIFTPQL
jgi:dimeric dUTPase (all-alpha-NTP-PPase superfamily)